MPQLERTTSDRQFSKQRSVKLTKTVIEFYIIYTNYIKKIMEVWEQDNEL